MFPKPRRRRDVFPDPVQDRTRVHEAHILLAEDNFINPKIRWLNCHIRADSAANGREVLDALQRISYDLISHGLSDAGDGRLRDFPNHSPTGKAVGVTGPWKSPVHIIALMAHALQGEREKCLGVGSG